MSLSNMQPPPVLGKAPQGALGQSSRPLSGRHQDLKFTLHRKLLDKINLDALASIETQTLRNEVRTALTQLVDSEQTLLSEIGRAHV